MAVALEVAVAEIVGEDHDDVGFVASSQYDLRVCGGEYDTRAADHQPQVQPVTIAQIKRDCGWHATLRRRELSLSAIVHGKSAGVKPLDGGSARYRAFPTEGSKGKEELTDRGSLLNDRRQLLGRWWLLTGESEAGQGIVASHPPLVSRRKNDAPT
jgi:hypothetical protein